MLFVLQARFEVDTRPVALEPGLRMARIEDELVRSGARDAHLVDDAAVSVTVAASSRGTANELVRDLLERVGASTVEIVDRP